ncbi:MAG: PAS domain S-box protein [Desulfobaccales bacterium]
MPKPRTRLRSRIRLIIFLSLLPLLGVFIYLLLYAFPPIAGLPGGGYVYLALPTTAISYHLPRTLPGILPVFLGVAALALLLAWKLGNLFTLGRLKVPAETAPHLTPRALSACADWTCGGREIDPRGQLAEDRLAQLRKQHELILASATEGILGLDLQGRHTFVNPAAAALLGYEVEELLGRPSHSTWHHSKEDGSHYPEEECHILETLKGDYRPNPVEEVFWKKDGTCFPVESNKNPILENGRIVGIVVTFTDISARKQAEKALRESEEHYRTLVKTSPYSILDMDLHGRITAANDRASWLTGYEIEELINHQAMDFITVAERLEAQRTIEEIKKTGSVRNRLFNVIRKDGTSFAAEVSASLIIDDLGQPQSIMAIFRNITHRLQGEKALKESEEKYRVLVNQIPAVVYKAYADCEIDFFDNKVEALTGYAKEDFDSRKLKWKELILPQDLQEAKQRFINALKTSKAYVREYRIRRKDRVIRWIHNRGNIFCDAAGKIEYVSGVLFDITDRKQAEEKLFRASRALRALGEVNQALVHATEEKAFLYDVCRIIVEVTGYRLSWVGVPQRDPGKTIMPVAQMGRNGEDANWIKNSWADDDHRGLGPGGSAIRTGQTQVVRNILENPVLAPWHEEARRRHYNSVIVLPLTLEGETIAILDILSEEVNAFDSEEIRLLEELANNVSQGVAILRERAQRRQTIAEKAKLEVQLRQAQKMEAIGTLAGGIAHDFNNILSAIVGYSELILINLDQKQDIQVIENHLNGVLQAGKRAKDLVQQILTFSRKKEQGKQPVQINLIILEAIKLLRASLPSTIEIYSNIAGQREMVLADPTQIHQVVMNMGANAYHAMRDNGGVLDISLDAVEVDAALAHTHPHLHPGSYLRLGVRDNGHGMEPEVLERIFEPYFTTKSLSEGTGLGLAVVHGIVSNLDGAIMVDSQLGKGTTFQVYLPRLDGTGQGEIPEVAAAEPIVVSVRGEHILFIDDEPVLAHIGEKILKRLGYRVTVKTSGLEALELFSAHPEDFDLVISDQTMPHLTGIQLAQKIIRLRPEIPIILCTGSCETITTKRVQDNGIRDYLMKPFNVGDLAKTIQRVLHPEESASPAKNLDLTC